MRTLILSDIHLGNDGGYDIFAGEAALPALLDAMVSPPTRVILNGDTVDFLMNQDPLELEVERAVQQAQAITAAPATRAVFAALGRVLAGGGEVIVGLGNHDAELALGEVQAVFRAALAQPAEVAAKLVFTRGEEPLLLELGGARILVAHGEHNDPWNRLDYGNLPGPGAPESAKAERFRYPPGSKLVKTLLNPLKIDYGLRFADLLKPDFQGAVLTTLAVNPAAFKTLFQGSTLSLMWQLFRQSLGPMTFEGDEEDLGLVGAMEAAGLTEEEHEAIEALIDPDAPAMFADDDDPILDRARIKLGRAGLKLYAATQRVLTGKSGATYFDLEPGKQEWKEAQRLAKKFDADAVILGHTHSARFKHQDDVLFINTGTWIHLMRLPAPDAPTDAWSDFLSLCRCNPGLDPTKGDAAELVTRFTGCLIEADDDGAEVSLVEYTPETGLTTLGQGRLSRA